MLERLVGWAGLGGHSHCPSRFMNIIPLLQEHLQPAPVGDATWSSRWVVDLYTLGMWHFRGLVGQPGGCL